MRKYKDKIIPDREEITDEDIETKQMNYCDRSYCGGVSCDTCLFSYKNIEAFTEWYLSKNKKKPKGFDQNDEENIIRSNNKYNPTNE